MKRWHRRGDPPPSPASILIKSTTHETMTRFEVYVPSAPYESESTWDLDRAWDLCLSLSEEFGYAQVRQDGIILGDYTNGGV
jgi:hypothetical protein